MKVISTLRTERFESTDGRPSPSEDRRSVHHSIQIAHLTGRVITYFLRLIRERFTPLQVATPIQKAPFVSQYAEHLPAAHLKPAGAAIRSAGEPPDIPDLGPPGFFSSTIQQAFTPFLQHPMNEQLLLSKSPDETACRAVPDTGGGPAFVRSKPSTRSSFPELLSPFAGYAQCRMTTLWKGVGSAVALLLLWLMSSPAQAQAPATVNLSLHKAISNQAPAIGAVVTYTVVVTNAPGSATATNVVVTDELPLAGVTYVPSSASTLRGNATFTSVTSASATTGTWNISAITPGDSAVLVLQATVNASGVWFNTAEITAADQTDINSIPGNQSLTEDDYDAVCFSIPILFYGGDEYTVSVPAGYDQIVWYRDNTPISTSSVSASLAVVNLDFSLTIKSPGTYRFDAFRNGCQSGNCCNIQIDPAPAGLGDFVFFDNNGNGVQDGGEPGVPGVTVTLLASTTAGVSTVASTTTSSSTANTGFYSFTGLTPGTTYTVVFDPTTLPAGFTLTSPNATTDTADSDADPVTGATSPVSLTAGEFNPTIDAGIRPAITSSILVSVIDPAVCNPLTNIYSTTATVSLVNVSAGTLTITDNGVVTASVSVTAGQTTAAFNLTGLSGSLPGTHTVVASLTPLGSLTTLTSSTTYAVPISCTVCATIALAPAILVNGLVGTPYSQTITASGGTAPYTFAVVGSLPAGLVFDVTTGVFSGTPSSATATSFSVLVTDSRSCTGTASFSLSVGLTSAISVAVNAPICNTLTNGFSATATISLVGIPAGTLVLTDNGVVTASVSVTAGQTTASVNLTGLSGSLPATHTVVASLTPLGSLTTLTASTTYATPTSCTLCTTIALAPAILVNGLVGTPYSQTITASGGTAPYTFAVVGSLPAGLVFDVTTGVFSGTPTSATATSFSVLVTDSRSCTGTASFSLSVGLTSAISVAVNAPVCNTLTNGFSATATISLVGIPAGTLVLTDNGVVTASVSVTAGQTTASVNLTGLSGSLPATHTVVATLTPLGSLTTLTASTTYATPTSCTLCATIALAPASLANGQVNSPYSQTITATGGVAPYTFAVINGLLPVGLSFDVTTGVLSGTPTSATAASFTVLVTDSRACTATAAYTVTPIPAFLLLIVADPTVCNPLSNVYSTTGVVTLVSAPAGTLTITDNGVVAVTVSVTAGQTSVPFNLTGISGTSPTTHTLVATLSSLSATATYDIPTSCTTCQTIALAPAILVNGLVGTPYSQTLTATGGTAPYSFAIVGSLPAGLVFDVTTGVFSGTPTSATATSFTVLVTDSRSCTGTASFSLSVGLTSAISVAVNAPVCNTLTNGFSATATVSLVGIPAGTLVLTDNGVVTASVSVTAGQTTASVNLTGLSGSLPATHTVVATLTPLGSLTTLTASTTYATPTSCTLCTTIALAPAILVNGLVGTPYSQTLTASGGTAPYTFAVINGLLPVGLSFDVTTGVFSGTPTSATATSFSVLVTDSRSCTGTAAFSLTVGTTSLTSLSLSITDPAVCNPLTNIYSTTAVATLVNITAGVLTITDNGVVTASVSVTAGQTSVVFSLTGLSGTSPTTHTVVATLTPLGSLTTLTASTTYAVPPSCTACSAIALSPATLIGGQLGAAYSQTITASGGTAPYTFAVLSGTLPAGLSLNTTTGVLSGTPTSATATAFAVLVTDARSCTGTAAYSLTVGTNCPTNFSLVVSADASICNGDSVQLTASTPIAGATLYWFLTPYDGVAFATVTSGQSITVKPTTTTVYYVEAVTADGCRSARRPVVVTVTTVPTPICLGNIKNTCPATTVNLTLIQIENQATGLVYEWYTSISRSEATRVTNLTAVGAGKYYLFARSGNCYSNPTVLTVEIVDCNCQNVAGVNVGPGLVACSGEAVPLKAVLSGSATSVIWTSSGTGVFSNPTSLTTTYTPSASDSTSGSVLLTATTNDPDGPRGVCAAATSSLILKINKRPAAPLGVACDDTLVCQGSSTKLVGFAPGAKINWYDSDNKLIGTTVSGGKLVVTPSRAGAVVYTAEAVSPEGCVSSTRSSLTITVGTCLADLAVVKQVVTPGPYSIGQKITYSITTTNNGPITGTAVNVRDLLPSALTYVSATPAGQYNVGTGVWTIGTLTTGSNRSLLIEATINAGGSIKNTAIVGGSNNDPLYAQNDTSSVTIDVLQCAVQPPSIDCAITQICLGGSTTLKAVGCAGGLVRWSDGQSGATVTVSPTLTTTYSASCVIGNCVSVASNVVTVTVTSPATPIITASADNVCPGTSVTLTAGGCVGGTIEWSEQAQVGASIVVTPYTKTTYTAQCRVGSCLSTPAIKTINIASDLPTPTVTCSATSVCPGETVTLTVNNCLGTPYWSTGETTASIVVTPTAGNNSYTVYCKNGACTSKPSATYTIEVITPAIPTVTASADSICAGSKVILTATGCTGTVLWSTGQTGASISVYPTASISYYAQCKYRTCLSEPSNSVTITVLTPSAPIITADKTLICSGEKVKLTAEGCEGIVKWYGTDKIGASIEIIPAATAEYYATCKQGSCESEPSNKVRITVNTTSGTPPQIVTSTTAVCSGGLASLTATGCSGTVLWSDGQTGPVVSVSVTPTNNTFYAICKTGSQCGSPQSNVIKINVTPMPTPTVTCSTDSICPGETVTLTVNNCLGTPYWSTGETKVTIVVSPTVTTSYTVYCQNGTCRSNTSINYTIKVVPVAAPTITASATVVEPGGTVSLSATGCLGEVIWSAADINGNNRGATIVVRPEGTQTYYAQCKYRTCLSEPSIPITVNPGNCTVKAGSLTAVTTVCSGSATTVIIAATPNGGLVQPAGYSVNYILTKGGVVQQVSAASQFTVTSAAADYTIHTLVFNANAADKNYLDLALVKPGITTAVDLGKLIADKKICAALDGVGVTVKVRFVEPPRLYGLPSLTVCSGSTVTLGAIGCDGGVVTWQDGSIGQTIEKTVYSDLWIMATCTIDGCTSAPSHSVDVTLGTPGIPTIVCHNPNICISEPVTLKATGCEGGTYIWSDGKTIGNTLTVTPTADVSYRVRCKIGTCEGEWSPYTTIRVSPPTAPTISIVGTTASSATVCFGAPVTLTAQGCPAGSYVTWSNDLVGQSITVSLAKGGTYTARCCNSSTCKSEPSNALTITVLPKVSLPLTVDRTNTCPFNTVDLSTAVTSQASTSGGVFEFYTNASLSSGTKVANPAAVGSGTYYVVEKTSNGCYSLPNVIHVHITTCGEQVPCNALNPATASAGADASICAAKSYQLSGVMGGAGQTAHWTTSGSGSFDNPFLANATYTASAEDVLSGKVTLTLSVSTANASCPVATDAMVLTIEGSKSVPTVTVIGATNLCYGDSVTLQAPAGATYLWSNKAKTQSIVVKNSGAYSVQLFDPKGCSSVKSADVVVTVSNPSATPLVHNLRNACPAQIADLTSALSATTAGSTYEYRIGASAASEVVMRPDSVGAGTYYVFEHNPTGCLSAPAKVDVSIFNCVADSLTTDVSIVKTVSSAAVQSGEPVTYTIKVSNLGQHTANNIDVRDVLPSGLELVTASAASYSVSNGVLTKRIDSLQAGQSDSIVFAARVITKGTVVNTAEITYLDQNDTDLANNTSSVTVTDTSARRPSLIGLAKSVLGIPTAVGDSLINVSYNFVVTNFGDDTLHTVQVEDDLAYFFVPNTVVQTTTTMGANSTLKANSAFTGADVKLMLDSASYLAPGRSETFRLDVTVRRAAGDTTQSFKNIGIASATNSVTNVSDLSTDGGDPDPDGDGDPTNNTEVSSFTLGVGQPGGPRIGLALAVVRIEKQADSTYNVTYKATIKNFGDVDLYGISLTDSLGRAFASPVSYSLVGTPVVSAGSNLVVNPGFDGNAEPNLLANSSHLAVSEQDTVVFTVNIKPNGNLGPFFSSATATGQPADSSQVVSDISNNGFDPTPEGAVSTAVRFDLPKGLLGVAKAVGTPALVEEGVYDIPYTITVSNMGSVPLKRVQVVDNLSETFGHGALIMDNRIHVTADSSLTVDSLYTGQGLITNMLVDSLSNLPVGAGRSLSFVVRVDVKNADTLTFYNTARATALTDDNEPVEDMSTAGTNDDPDNDLDPRNNSDPTPVALNSLSSTPYIGVAMAVSDTARQTDGSFNVTYQIVVRNYGSEPLTAVTLNDSLSNVFNSQTGATFTLVKAPITTSTGSTLKLNPAFNGASDPVIVLGDSTSTLAPGKVDTILVVVNVAADGSTTTFLNSVYAQAKAKTVTVTDVSTNGLVPDLNGNNNPTDLNEREATPLNLPPNSSTVFIPQGFSPNGDGVNDVFVIQGTTGLTVSLEVYNRWGHLVYKNDDYQNDWDSKPNTGIALSSNASGLPDGTYYYVVRTSDGRKFVRYMTINR